MIHFTCHCGVALRADGPPGAVMYCPECGGENRVPEGGSVQPADAARAPNPPAAGAANVRVARPPTSRLALAALVLGLLSLFCHVWTAVPALILGAFALWDVGRSRGGKKGMVIAAVGMTAAVALPIGGFLIVRAVEERADRLRTISNLKNIALSMDSYHMIIGCYPPAAICDPHGKPLLSWRVALLPYIEEESLYERFKLDEPWDGPHNSKLLSQMPSVYALRADKTASAGSTYFRIFVGNGAAFDPPRPVTKDDWVAMLKPGLRVLSGGAREADYTDGVTNTIFVAEAASPVPWTKPEELYYDPDGPLPPLGGHFSGGYYVLLGASVDDVRFITPDVSEQTLRAAITRAGHDAPGPDWPQPTRPGRD